MATDHHQHCYTARFFFLVVHLEPMMTLYLLSAMTVYVAPQSEAGSTHAPAGDAKKVRSLDRGQRCPMTFVLFCSKTLSPVLVAGSNCLEDEQSPLRPVGGRHFQLAWLDVAPFEVDFQSVFVSQPRAFLYA